MAASSPAIDVVILTWNDGVLLQRAVDSAHGSEDVHVRVIVVDNGSEPSAHPTLSPGDELVRLEHNIGVAGGRNVGGRLGSAPLLCFLDSDAVLHADTLAILTAVLDADGAIAVAAPVFDDQMPEDSGGAAPTLSRKIRRVTGTTSRYEPGVTHGGLIDVDFAIGACQLVRRDAYDQVGGLDERYFYGPEDADFCMRLRTSGWRVVQAPWAGCEHPARRRHRRLLTAGGARHAAAVTRFLWRHRGFRDRVSAP